MATPGPSEKVAASDERPKFTDHAGGAIEDPVKAQKKKDAPPKKKSEVMPEKESIISAKIEPSVGTRVGLQYVHEVDLEQGQPRIKYDLPGEKQHRKMWEKKRHPVSKESCKYGFIQLPEMSTKKKMELEFDIPSPEVSSAKVAPRKVSPSSSGLYPYPPTQDELELKKPKSGILPQDDLGPSDYDSFDLVYSRTPRAEPPEKKKGSKKKRRKGDGLADIQEADEESGDRSERKKKKKKKKKKKQDKESAEEISPEAYLALAEEELMADGLGEGEEDMETYLTKQFRRKVSQISRATSYQSRDLHSILSEEILEEPAINKYIQKFRRESEIKRLEPPKRKFKRGTLESHSFTTVTQPTLRDFFFGSKEGTMHQGDKNFPEAIRNNQGICMSVAAYCFSILKHPNKWTSEDIDAILEVGNNLCLESIKKLHMHNPTKELKPEELQKYCVVGEKKVRFVVDEPEVTGFIRSDDKRVYNLTKALKIFFHRQSAGILKTQDISIAIWKDKYIYLYDARPRTRDLFCSPNGTAMMANFYDVPSLATVFLERSNFANWPFVIYTIKAFKVINKDDPEVDSKVELDVRSNYNIMNENKAVVLASFDLADKCFDFSRNKQSLTMATVCLVYSRITPPSAWHKTTLDKIMIVGNQLYLECMECESFFEIKVDNLPAIFTIGPYIVEIYIYMNMFADLLYKKCCCTLKSCLEEFFERSTNGILQIGKCHLAVWKQRNMYYCFDPYSRDGEAFRCRDGTACVSMHSNLESLVTTITTNFDNKDAVFYLHALKVCKIHRDPVQSARFPKHMVMDDFPVEDFKRYKMKKSRKPATEKPVTVDYSALAMRRLLAGESPENSIFEIGSTVESLGVEQIPPMVHKFPSRSVLRKVKPNVADVIADLDSPSLSDTQLEPVLPEQPKMAEEIEFMDLDSFELTQEEIELQEIEMAEGENYSEDLGGSGDYEDQMEEEYGGEDDWYMARHDFTQVGEYSLPKEISRISEQINTDMTYFPIVKDVLYPTNVRGKQQMRKRLQFHQTKDDEAWGDIFVPAEPQATKSEELAKETNFIDLPDDTQIIHGTKNVAEFGTDVEFMAPFVCIMAGVVSKKYTMTSWTGDIVDYILKCGSELYGASKFRYDQVSKLEIPRITLGNTHFTVLVEYVFDTYTRQNILELAIDKILFVRSDMGVLVTPTYACALFYKNYLYYMYDSFGNNEVGLSEGPENTGTACFSRFKDVHALVSRIMYNKRKRESNEEVIYTRFVLSSVKVKALHASQEEMRKKKKKDKAAAEGDDTTAGDDLEGGGGEEGPDVDATATSKKAEDGDEDSDEDVIEEGGKRRPKRSKAKNKIGYQIKGGLYVIEGTKCLDDRSTMSDELKQDHFVCLCACLMLLMCPVAKWDTKKVNQTIDHGCHIFSHAEDLEISEKRTIKNVLIHKNFFDVIVKMFKIENWKDNKNLSKGIDTLLKKKMSYFLVQFPNACYVIHKSQDDMYHLFDPYGYPAKDDELQAAWVRFKSLEKLKAGLKKIIIEGGEGYTFYNFEVTSIRKAPKGVVLSQRLEQYDLEYLSKKERFGKPFYEDAEWLKCDPLWSRRVNISAAGNERGKFDNLWHNWDVEYPKDLYSLVGNIHQTSERFAPENRGRQTLCNLIVALGMMEIYDLAEWNSAIVDSVLVNGDNYFTECAKNISDSDVDKWREMGGCMDDLQQECSIFPFSFMVNYTPVIEGTMFLVRNTQFNLYKALRYFFNNVKKRMGLIYATTSRKMRSVAFGKLRESEYFMFDCDSMGAPMFPDKRGAAYILRMTTLNRLLHVLTLTLRGGDFYIYEIDVTDVKPIN